MKHLIRTPHRCLLLVVLALLFLISGASLAATRRSPANTQDCPGVCREVRDRSYERCDKHTDNDKREKCREQANKHYDKCVERCSGGVSGTPGAE